MSDDLPVCDECGIEKARYVMYPTSTDDDERSNGPVSRCKVMCEECARLAAQNGGWEYDD